jgi:RNA polymerase sigma-70 factor (ECF subfamily)
MTVAATPAPATAGSEAMTALWRTHGSALLQFALKLTLGDWYRAEDIVQETMVRAWRHPEVVGAGHIRPWLLTVTRHAAIDMWRSRARAEAAEAMIGDVHDRLPDPAEPIDQAVIALDMRAALAQLSPRHRQVIIEMYYRGHSVAETAEILGIPPGTVKSRCCYGLRRLRRAIAPRP